MKLYFIFTRRRLFVALLGIILLLLIASRVSAVESSVIKGGTNEQRLAFLQSLGIENINKDASKKEISIPAHFNDVMKRYNNLQLKSGFDLSDYAGERLKMYTYEFEDGLGAVHIIVYGQRIVGGDIAEYSLDGKMLPLKNYGENNE